MGKFNLAKSYVFSSKGIILSEEFHQQGFNKYDINKLLGKGVIERYTKGVYVRKDTIEDPFYIFQKKNPTVVFSYNTAMYFHRVSEVIPVKMDVTVYTGYNSSHFSSDIQVHYTKKDNLNLGITTITTPLGFEVLSYDLERITCDMIAGRNIGIDKEQANKFIRKMFLEKRIDTIKLIEYSKRLKCEKKVRQVMEVLS